MVGYDVDRLPDEAVVVRGGVMHPRDMRINAEAHHLEMAEAGLDEWALSVFSAPDLGADEIATIAPIRHPKIRVTTVGALRAAGYEVTPSPDVAPLHADLRFMSEPTEEDFETLGAVFDEPRPHPRLAEEGNDG